MSELSPQAQAVLDAYSAIQWQPGEGHHVQRIAAALRAVADQVVPEQLERPTGSGCRWGAWADWGAWALKSGVRSELLTIAAELENNAN